MCRTQEPQSYLILTNYVETAVRNKEMYGRFFRKSGSRCNRYDLYGNATDIASCIRIEDRQFNPSEFISNIPESLFGLKA